MIQDQSHKPLPRVVMTLLVRNEADVITDNLLFHRHQGIDQFIVMDNGSTDGTQAIVEELAQQLPIELLHQPADDYAQAEWVTAMARLAWSTYQADWVINNDADEFWVFPDGGASAYLAGLPSNVASVLVPRHNAVLVERPDPWTGPSSHPATTDLFERCSLNSAGHPLPPKCLHRGAAEVQVHQGNHNVDGVSGVQHKVGPMIPGDVGSNPYILHYPYRSFRSYQRKITLGGAAYARNTNLPPSVGATWREQYQQLQEQGLEQFWRELHRSRSAVDVAELSGSLWRDRSVVQLLQEGRAQWQQQRLDQALERLRRETAQVVEQRQKDLIARLESQGEAAAQTLFFHNFSFAIAGLRQHLNGVQALCSGIQAEQFCGRFAELRDLASLCPDNPHLPSFLCTLLELAHADAVRELRHDLLGQRVRLHLSCVARLSRSQMARRSFAQADGAGVSVIVVGDPSLTTSDCSQLGFRYSQGVLHVPVSDRYEHLASKLFYALLLLQLLVAPAQLVKLDDDLHLEDQAVLETYLAELEAQQVAYAGWQVGSRHHEQWHGWHVDKCTDPLLHRRGYQYPLPRHYAAGGFGYVLGEAGLQACAAIFLGMRSFFEQPCVQLEDAFVGLAMEQRGLSLQPCNHLRPGPIPPVGEAALPGLKRVDASQVA
jgi:hypothetical protein